MNKRKIYILVLCLMSVFTQELIIKSDVENNSISFENSFKKGNDFYLEKNYDSTIFYYKMLEKDFMSSSLFYNLGNAYFQKNDLALSILYFEKAIKLDPNNEDIQHNLAIAQEKQGDVFENKDFFFSWSDKLVNIFGYSDWMRAVWVFAILFWLSFACYLFVKRFRTVFIFIISLVLSIACLFMAYRAHYFLTHPEFLIVLKNNTAIYVEPSNNADILHTLHEGAKLKILQENNTYYQIQTLSQSKGWVKKEFVGAI